jgi:hypothetical protein
MYVGIWNEAVQFHLWESIIRIFGTMKFIVLAKLSLSYVIELLFSSSAAVCLSLKEAVRVACIYLRGYSEGFKRITINPVCRRDCAPSSPPPPPPALGSRVRKEYSRKCFVMLCDKQFKTIFAFRFRRSDTFGLQCARIKR